MAAALNLLCALLLLLVLCAISKGDAQGCDASSIEVDQTRPGGTGMDTEFAVEVRNACSCDQGEVRLSSNGFASSRPVDPALFRLDGDNYIVNDGKPIAAGASVKFSYWFDRAFAFSYASSKPACS